MESDEYGTYRKLVVQGSKSIFNAGLVQFGEGNVSIRVKRKDEIFITPSQNDYESLTTDDVVHLQMDGTQLSKGRPTSSEYKLHTTIYRARKKVNCVIHTHAPYAAMLSITGKELPPIFEEMLIFIGGSVKIARYSPSGNDELGEVALEAMGDINCCLLTNHSMVACGRDLEKTLKTINLLEKMSRIYYGALLLGEEISIIPEEHQKKFKDYFKGLYSTAPIRKRKKE
ncbi:MAG: class II aldolase/adducin family protein [Promethearchaeota archaeon]